MANQVTNYKCPACTGPLRFDSATGKLQCDFCGSSYEVAEIEKLYAEKDAQAAGAFRQAEEQAAAAIEAARREAEMQRQMTQTEVARREAERKVIGAQAEAQAQRMQA